MDLYLRPHYPNSDHRILSSVTWDLHSIYHSVVYSTPEQLIFVRNMVINATYIANWHYIHNTKLTNNLRNNIRENKSRLPNTYKPGGQVFVSFIDIKRKLASKT